MSCWALWQRLPLRYQLSHREPDVSSDINLSISSPRSTRSPRTPMSSGRTRSARDYGKRSMIPTSDRGPEKPHDVSPKQPQPAFEEEKATRRQGHVNNVRSKGRATMFFTVQTSPREDPGVPTSHCHAGFPSRGSSYLASFKQNQRINSTRQNFLDPSTSPQASPRLSKAPNLKRQTVAVQFPVTKFQSQEVSDSKSSNTRQIQYGCGSSKVQHCYNRSTPTERFKTNQKIETSDSPGLSVNTLLPVNEIKPFVKNPVYSEARNNRYVLKTGQSSSVFIDNDKIVVMNSARPYPHSAPSSRENSASYLAHLRRLYLKDPKDFAKANRSTGIESTKRKLLYERLEYDKRTDSILNYYSRADDVEIATAWASAVEFSRRPKTTPSSLYSKKLEGSKTSRPHRSPTRPTSSRTRPNSARFPFRNGDANSPRDALEDWGEFLKINSRSALHERQFYLRTPALRQECVPQATTDSQEQQDPCVCRMCIVEAELGMARYQHVIPSNNEYDNGKGEEYYPLLENDNRGLIVLSGDKETQMRDKMERIPKEGIIDHINLEKVTGDANVSEPEESKVISERSEAVHQRTRNQECKPLRDNHDGIITSQIEIGAIERVSLANEEGIHCEQIPSETAIKSGPNKPAQTIIGDIVTRNQTNTSHTEAQLPSDAGAIGATVTAPECEIGDNINEVLENVIVEVNAPSKTLVNDSETKEVERITGVSEGNKNNDTNEFACNVPKQNDSNCVEAGSEIGPNNLSYPKESDFTRDVSRINSDNNESTSNTLQHVKSLESGFVSDALMDIKTGDLYVKFEKDSKSCELH